MYTVMEYQGKLIDTLMGMAEKAIACQYTSAESSYGAADSIPCGKDAVGNSLEDEQHRCQLHLLK